MSTEGRRAIDRFRVVAAVEATTLLVLVTAAVLRATLDGPDLSGSLGPLHGIVFVAYVVLALRARSELGWGTGRTVAVILLAAVPAAGYVVAARLAGTLERSRV